MDPMAEDGRALRGLVEQVLEPGERMMDMLPVDVGACRLHTTPAPPKELDIPVFGAPAWQGDSVSDRVFGAVFSFLGASDPPRGDYGDPARRQKALQKKEPFWGPWDSLAGGLLRGLRPLGPVAHKILLMTDRRAQLVYLGSEHGLGRNAALRPEPGWRCTPQELVWVRDCKDHSKGHYQLGFHDGSWMPVYFARKVRDRFDALFPQAQHWKKPLPDVWADLRFQRRA
ncbi:hypothetical protein [Streptomyces sp. NPDC007100]|uniref:hypothetical protein n=1 Tax=Streptomyces sp. NPDC007100 TaxID=3155602 RepID=UPI0033FE17D0